jgi:hypothetical protein
MEGKDYFAWNRVFCQKGEPTMNAKKPAWLPWLAAGVSMGVLLSSVGCQVNMAGQTLPSPYYMSDDVQYFAPGPEFKLQREAAAQKAYKEEQILQGLQP